MINVKTLVVGDLNTNCYIITQTNNNFALVIDPGENYNGIINEISAQSKQVGGVLLTHAHFDHSLEICKFKQKNVPIYMAKKEEEVSNTGANLGAYFGYDFTPFCADNGLIGGLFEICGFKIRVLETPGHTVGSVCYLIEDYLFSGDTLFRLGYGRTDLPTGDIDALIKSLKKLFELEGDYRVLPGHGESSTLDYERKNNPILEHIK